MDGILSFSYIDHHLNRISSTGTQMVWETAKVIKPAFIHGSKPCLLQYDWCAILWKPNGWIRQNTFPWCFCTYAGIITVHNTHIWFIWNTDADLSTQAQSYLLLVVFARNVVWCCNFTRLAPHHSYVCWCVVWQLYWLLWRRMWFHQTTPKHGRIPDPTWFCLVLPLTSVTSPT